MNFLPFQNPEMFFDVHFVTIMGKSTHRMVLINCSGTSGQEPNLSGTCDLICKRRMLTVCPSFLYSSPGLPVSQRLCCLCLSPSCILRKMLLASFPVTPRARWVLLDTQHLSCTNIGWMRMWHFIWDNVCSASVTLVLPIMNARLSCQINLGLNPALHLPVVYPQANCYSLIF